MSDQNTQAGSLRQGAAHAAAQAASAHSVRIVFEGIGTVELPPREDLASFAGLGCLAVIGILEWPLAGVLAAGHVLSRNSHNKALHEFGEALEAA